MDEVSTKLDRMFDTFNILEQMDKYLGVYEEKEQEEEIITTDQEF